MDQECLTVLNVYVSYYKPLTQTNTIHITHPADVFKGWTDDDNGKPHCWDSYLKKENSSISQYILHMHSQQFHKCMMYWHQIKKHKKTMLLMYNHFVIHCVQMIAKCSQTE